jgi:uncharacterized protein YktA (UPF0223 family)
MRRKFVTRSCNYKQLEFDFEFPCELDMAQDEIDYIIEQFDTTSNNYDDFINDEEVQANYWK